MVESVTDKGPIAFSHLKSTTSSPKEAIPMGEHRLHGMKYFCGFCKIRWAQVDEINIVNKGEARQVNDLFGLGCGSRVAEAWGFHGFDDHRA